MGAAGLIAGTEPKISVGRLHPRAEALAPRRTTHLCEFSDEDHFSKVIITGEICRPSFARPSPGFLDCGDLLDPTPIYRVTVAAEIRKALRSLPRGIVQDVTVEVISRGILLGPRIDPAEWFPRHGHGRLQRCRCD